MHHRAVFSSWARSYTMHADQPTGEEGREIVLASDGVESSTLLHQECKAQRSINGLKPLAMFFDYGQRRAEGER